MGKLEDERIADDAKVPVLLYDGWSLSLIWWAAREAYGEAFNLFYFSIFPFSGLSFIPHFPPLPLAFSHTHCDHIWFETQDEEIWYILFHLNLTFLSIIYSFLIKIRKKEKSPWLMVNLHSLKIFMLKLKNILWTTSCHPCTTIHIHSHSHHPLEQQPQNIFRWSIRKGVI